MGWILELYPWQEKVINSYKSKGTVKAVTGAGKSLVGRKIAERIKGKIIVTAPTLSILDQWILIMNGIKNVEFITFMTLCKQEKECDLIIIDECHRSVSPEYIKLYDKVKYKNILGLSATPNKQSLEMCGEQICDIGFNEANISPFLVTFHGIELSFQERQEYRKLSYSIGKLMQKEFKNKKDNDILNNLIMKRRGIVYNADKRIPKAMKLIFENWDKGHKILVICQRCEQANQLSKQLKYLPHIQYHSKQMDDLDKYRKGEVRVCISVGMLNTGFDDISTDVGIIVSTPLSESFHIQAIGRIIRHKPNKVANVHILLANQTTDTKVLRYSNNYDFELVNIIIPADSEYIEGYHNGEMYGFSCGKLWKRDSEKGRIYFKDHPILKELEKVKREGGRFSIHKTGVFTKVDRKIIKVTNEQIELEEEPQEDKNITFDEICNWWKK